jgi:hypothetical protein
MARCAAARNLPPWTAPAASLRTRSQAACSSRLGLRPIITPLPSAPGGRQA